VDSIRLDPDKVQWLSLVNTVMNLLDCLNAIKKNSSPWSGLVLQLRGNPTFDTEFRKQGNPLVTDQGAPNQLIEGSTLTTWSEKYHSVSFNELEIATERNTALSPSCFKSYPQIASKCKSLPTLNRCYRLQI
jgi:hypothetical protein